MKKSGVDNNNNNNNNNINIKGIIVAWSGNIANIPAGWAFCNGKKYKLDSAGKAILNTSGTLTPDLRSRFIIGASVDKMSATLPLINGLSNYAVKNTGGVEKVILSKDQMPSHAHDVINIINQAVGCYGSNCLFAHPVSKVFPLIAKSGDQLENKNNIVISAADNVSPYSRPAEIPVETGFMGDSKPHENMPPYYALAYIMKL
jgi:microcystin-dependent protein